MYSCITLLSILVFAPLLRVVPDCPRIDISGPSQGFRSYTTISKLSEDCVFITGSSPATNSFFVESCSDRTTVKESTSIGYIFDAAFAPNAGLRNGVMIVSGGIYRFESYLLSFLNLPNVEQVHFKRVIFRNEKSIWAVGSKGKIMGSADGGSTWVESKSPTTAELTDITFSEEKRGWIVGVQSNAGRFEKFVVLRTEDGGATWEIVDEPIDGGFERIQFLNSAFGWALSKSGGLVVTKDGGKIWIKTKANISDLDDVVFLDTQNAWAVSGNELFQTANTGVTWKRSRTLPKSHLSAYRLLFTNRQNGWLFSKGMILRTIDGGKNWNEFNVDSRLSPERLKEEK